jgi:hypothetical protein
MSVHVEWDNQERTAVLWSFIGRWTWGEFDDAVATLSAMYNTVNHPVDLLCDTRQMSILPPDIVSRFKSNYLKRMGKTGKLVFVGMDNDLQLFWDIFTDLPYARQLKARYFDTLEEARAFLARSREQQ